MPNIMEEIPSLLSNWKELIFRMQSSDILLVEVIILFDSQVVCLQYIWSDLMDSMHSIQEDEGKERSRAISRRLT